MDEQNICRFMPAKPAPDVYLRALELCGATARQAAAVEDSDTGIAAAKAAGPYSYSCAR